MIDQILADISSAPNLEFLAQIWAFCTTQAQFGPQDLARLGAACQARDSALREAPVAPPVLAPPVLVAPTASLQEQAVQHVQQRAAEEAQAPQVLALQPAGPTPDWMKTAAADHIALRGATGQGGAPALDNLRMALVDLSCAMHDCGINTAEVEGLRNILAATPQECEKLAKTLLWIIQNHVK